MHRTCRVGEFADEEIYVFFSGPSGYSDKNDRNTFPGKGAPKYRDQRPTELGILVERCGDAMIRSFS
jgi:hypothetical protein